MKKRAYICVYRILPSLQQPVSNQVIAELIGYGKSTVEGAITDLKNAGLVRSEGVASKRVLFHVKHERSDEEIKDAIAAVTYRENVYSVKPKITRSPRNCLTCKKKFQSEGIHNRLCDWCRQTVGAVQRFVA